MSEQATKGLVPVLRFPEFRDEGEWTNSLLGKLLIGSPDYGVNAAAVPFADNLPKYLRITDISEDGQYLPDKQVSVDLDATDENYLDEGDIVLARTGASVGKSYRYRKNDGKLVFAGFLIRVKPDPRLLISTYLANFLTTDHFWKWVAVTSARSGQPGVNSTEYCSLVIPLPPNISEQQKIADCLSSLDDLITAQTQKLEALKAHKKALMQQLFPAEGETVPKLRFPEFRDAGEWERDKLANLIVTVTPPKKLPTGLYQAEGQFPIIDQSQSYICGWTNDQDALINDDLPLIIFGDHTCALKIVDMPFAQGADGIKILKNKKQTEIGYLYQYLLFNPVVMEEYKRYFSILKEKLIFFPKKESGEQQKIADCLFSIDELIDVQTQKLEALKAHKKGMLQKLFPSMDETTE